MFQVFVFSFELEGQSFDGVDSTFQFLFYFVQFLVEIFSLEFQQFCKRPDLGLVLELNAFEGINELFQDIDQTLGLGFVDRV